MDGRPVGGAPGPDRIGDQHRGPRRPAGGDGGAGRFAALSEEHRNLRPAALGLPGRPVGGHRGWGVFQGIGGHAAARDRAVRGNLVEGAAAGVGPGTGIDRRADPDSGDAVSARQCAVVVGAYDFSFLRQPDRRGRIRHRQADGPRSYGQVPGAAGLAGAALLRLFVVADSTGGRGGAGLAGVGGAGGGHFPGGGGGVGAAIAAGVLLWRGRRTARFLAGAALLVFLPTSNLLFPIGTIMAERFLYLPAIAFAAGVVAAVGAAEKRAGDARLAPALLGLIAL